MEFRRDGSHSSVRTVFLFALRSSIDFHSFFFLKKIATSTVTSRLVHCSRDSVQHSSALFPLVPSTFSPTATASESSPTASTTDKKTPTSISLQPPLQGSPRVLQRIPSGSSKRGCSSPKSDGTPLQARAPHRASLRTRRDDLCRGS